MLCVLGSRPVLVCLAQQEASQSAGSLLHHQALAPPPHEIGREIDRGGQASAPPVGSLTVLIVSTPKVYFIVLTTK